MDLRAIPKRLFLCFFLCAAAAAAQQTPDWTSKTGRSKTRAGDDLYQVPDPDSTWKDRDGNTRTRAELDRILSEHEVWLRRNMAPVTNVRRANLSGTDLRGANLEGANLQGADLSRADLRGVNLIGAKLQFADLQGTDLRDANLIGAKPQGANLQGANLEGANLQGAVLSSAKLQDATLTAANLSGADLFSSNLSGAILEGANLQSAELVDADLQGAKLSGAKLQDASLFLVDLKGATFDPISNPSTRSLATAKNLETLKYYMPDALTALRKSFEDGGFRGQERKITYVLKRVETERSWSACLNKESESLFLRDSDGRIANCASFVLNRVFFDLTSQYGMSPGRPLLLGLALWSFCTLLYFLLLHAPKRAGLYRIRTRAIEDGPAQKDITLIERPQLNKNAKVWGLPQFLWQEVGLLPHCMFFSLMSAFNIGFREINFGRWLRLLTREEFDMRATGWARVIAGWQSLISVYFIALWVLTYFGRPFV
jgi:uncharacterized protein YjbI with pentapeptide repeats